MSARQLVQYRFRPLRRLSLGQGPGIDQVEDNRDIWRRELWDRRTLSVRKYGVAVGWAPDKLRPTYGAQMPLGLVGSAASGWIDGSGRGQGAMNWTAVVMIGSWCSWFEDMVAVERVLGRYRMSQHDVSSAAFGWPD